MIASLPELLRSAERCCDRLPAYLITYEVAGREESFLVCRSCAKTDKWWTTGMVRAVDVKTGEFLTDVVKREAPEAA